MNAYAGNLYWLNLLLAVVLLILNLKSQQKKRDEQEYANKVSELLKQCKEWRQVYRLYKITCKHFNWVEGEKVYGMTQVVLSMEFKVLELKAQIRGL